MMLPAINSKTLHQDFNKRWDKIVLRGCYTFSSSFMELN